VSTWGARRWGVALAGTIVVALAIALPTELIPNPVFDRMTPTVWWNYPVLAIAGVGLLVVALRGRLRGARACAIPVAADEPAQVGNA
jgi:predicted cobalt transporter CbtA